MRVDPEIAAMRRDRTVLQRAQAAARAAAGRWREDARVAPILAELGEFGRGAPLSSCPALARLFGPGDVAQGFAAGFCRAQAEALAAERFAQLAFRHSWTGPRPRCCSRARARRTWCSRRSIRAGASRVR
jgi:hypothetical protein